MLATLLDVLGLLAVPLLVGMNAFFVAAEFSLVTVRWTRVEELVAERKFGALAVRYAVENLDDAIAATQLGITFASLALGWVGEPTLSHLLQPLFAGMPGWWGPAATHAAAIAHIVRRTLHLHIGAARFSGPHPRLTESPQPPPAPPDRCSARIPHRPPRSASSSTCPSAPSSASSASR